MRSWLVRLGRYGEDEARALEQSELVLGWTVANPEAAGSREGLEKDFQQQWPNEKLGTLKNWAVQVNQFCNAIAPGDLAVVPLKSTGQIAFGTIVGSSGFVDQRPMRRVTWLKTDLPRDQIGQDLLYSLGAIGTVCEVSRNDAAKRLSTAAATGRDPSLSKPSTIVASQAGNNEGSVDERAVDLETLARDAIERQIAVNFSGHGFTELIAALLRAEGYLTRVSPPGADRGVDIVAGTGALGFDGPKLVVQVKSGDTVVDHPTLQSLLGCIHSTRAEHGLLVSWSGFKSTVRNQTNELYFQVRLWGREEIMAAIFANYERLPESLRAQLPLRRVWTLVQEF